jgi:hypothetical protein
LLGIPDSVFSADEDTSSALRSFLSAYPEAEGWSDYHGTFVSVDEHKVKLTWPVGAGPRLPVRRRCAATRAQWLVPKLNSQEPPEILLLWWLVLFALSMSARYDPAGWAEICDFDTSPLAVPLQALLDEALEALPVLILAALNRPRRTDKSLLASSRICRGPDELVHSVGGLAAKDLDKGMAVDTRQSRLKEPEYGGLQRTALSSLRFSRRSVTGVTGLDTDYFRTPGLASA